MTSRTLGFEITLALLVMVFLISAGRWYLTTKRTSASTWEDLVKRLNPVDHNKIALIAMDILESDGGCQPEELRLNLEPSSIWVLIGGLKGVEALEANCDVLVDLACYLQLWYPEALAIAEQLRLSSRELRWHLGRLRGAARTGNLQSAFPEYAQRAVMIYYLMTRQVLMLYEAAAAPGLSVLHKAL